MRLDRSRRLQRRRMLAAVSMLVLLIPAAEGFTLARAEGPLGLGRLFRFGKDRPSEPDRPDPSPRPDSPPDIPEPTPESPSPYNPSALYPGGYGSAPMNLPTPSPTTGPASPVSPGTSANRLIPQPRNSHAVTEADPVLTRVSLGRSDDGRQFGMFFQVYADGTIIDTEGVHHVSHDDLRPLVNALRAADVGRLKGYCGGPPTDFVEQVQLTVYDQNRGRLQANHFSYSGNPQGCDPSVQALQAAINALQMKVASPAPASPTTEPAPTSALSSPTSGGVPVPPAPPGLSPANDAAPPPPESGAPIGLTPVQE